MSVCVCMRVLRFVDSSILFCSVISRVLIVTTMMLVMMIRKFLKLLFNANTKSHMSFKNYQ